MADIADTFHRPRRAQPPGVPSPSAAPADAVMALARSHGTLLAHETSTLWAEIALTGPPDADEATRTPADLVIVLDGSSSMGGGGGSPFARAKEAADFAISQLHDNDRCAIICFGSDVRVVAELSSEHERTRAALARTVANGMTALCGGIERGIELLGSPTAGRTRQVFLLSDGHANVGETDPARIAARVQGAADAGVRLATFGVGEDYNETLLEQLALGGAGYHYLPDADAIPRAFATELSGLLAITADAVSCTLRPGRGVTVLRTLGMAWDDPTTLTAGGIPAGATRRALVELQLATAGPAARRTCATLEVSWRDRDGVAHTEKASVRVRVSEDPEQVSESVDEAVLARVVALEAAEVQRTAAALTARGDYRAAADVLWAAKQQLQTYAASSAPAAMQAGLLATAQMMGTTATQLAADEHEAALRAKHLAKSLRSSSYQTRTSRDGI